MSGEKRKKIVLTMEKKLRAIKRLDSGELIKKVASDLGVGKSTVSEWKKNRAEIEKWCLYQSPVNGMNARKTMKKSEHEKIGRALFLWSESVTAKGGRVTGPMLQEKALSFREKLEGGDSRFTASEGWIDRWKKRFGVPQLPIRGKSEFTDKNSVKDFKITLQKPIEEITDDDIVEMVIKEEPRDINDIEDEEIKIPHADGFQAIEAALEYVSQQNEATVADIRILRRWRKIAAKKRDKSIIDAANAARKLMDAKSLSLKRPLDTRLGLPSKRSKTTGKPKNTKKASTKQKKSAVNNNEGVREEQFSISFEESDVLSRVKQEPITDDDLVTVKAEVMPECRFETVLCGTGYVGMEEEEVNDRDTNFEKEIMGGKDQQEILQLSISERWSNLLKRSSAVIFDCGRPTGLPVCALNNDYSTSVENGPIYNKQEVNEALLNENQNPSDLKNENQGNCELSCNNEENLIFPKLEVSELKYEDLEPSDLLCEKQENIEVSENQVTSDLICASKDTSELSTTSQETSEPIIAIQETSELSVGSQGIVIDSKPVGS